MAALCDFSRFISSCTSLKLCAFRRPSFEVEEQPLQRLRWGARRYPSRKDVIMISASSTKKPSVRKKTKSNVDLYNDLREFLSTAGFPEGHVPSLKELSQHGRPDLANIVRRRGYKLITKLLRNSTKADSSVETSSSENPDGTNRYENESTGQDKNVNELAEGVSLLKAHEEKINGFPPLNSGIQSYETVGSSTSSSLQEKAAKFVQSGELDTIEVEDSQLLNESNISYGIWGENGVDKDERCSELEDEIEESKAFIEESSKYKATGSNATSILNEGTLTFKEVAPPTTERDPHRNDLLPAEGLKDADLEEDMYVETSERDNQLGVNHLKVLLHQKELELSQLKEQIEKEKHALSILQTKAETEISKAQKLVSEKDAELHVAEESLSGLKEVQVEYWANAENVEVAGSFNGWDNQIKMDPHPPTNTINPLGSRKSRLWSTMLWLYPGIYEIKFIVDGHWRIDPQRETVTSGNIQNNILRVDR